MAGQFAALQQLVGAILSYRRPVVAAVNGQAHNIGGQIARRGVARQRRMGHRLEADRFERRRHVAPHLPRPGKPALPDIIHQHRRMRMEGRTACEEVVERRAEAVDIAAGIDQVDLAGCLLGAGEGRCSLEIAMAGRLRTVADDVWRDRLDPRTGAGGEIVPGHPGQPPVDDLRLAERAEHDVVRLDVTVEDTAAVRILDRLAGIDEVPEELAEAEQALGLGRRGRGGMMGADRLLERLTGDQPHDMEQPPILMLADVVDRRDVGMLERRPGPDLLEERRPVPSVVGPLVGELLEEHLAPELEVAADEHLPHPPVAVRPHEPVARAPGGVAVERDQVAGIGCRRAGGDGRRGIGCHAAIDDPRELRRDHPLRTEIGDALLGVAAMLLEMAGDDILDDSPRPPVDGFLLNEDLGDRPRRLADPLGGGGGELVTGDEIEVDRENRKQESGGLVVGHENSPRAVAGIATGTLTVTIRPPSPGRPFTVAKNVVFQDS